jgi:hypothetical protein
MGTYFGVNTSTGNFLQGGIEVGVLGVGPAVVPTHTSKMARILFVTIGKYSSDQITSTRLSASANPQIAGGPITPAFPPLLQLLSARFVTNRG